MAARRYAIRAFETLEVEQKARLLDNMVRAWERFRKLSREDWSNIHLDSQPYRVLSFLQCWIIGEGYVPVGYDRNIHFVEWIR